MNARKLCSVALALTSLVLAPAAVAAPLAYTVAVALPLDNPEAINDRGDFVGFNGITTRAFIYADGVRTELGTLGGPTSIAYGINNKGVVVGESSLPSGLPHAFMYDDGVMSDIGTLGGLVSSARIINNAGKIVGVSATGVGFEQHAFLYDQGAMLDLGSLGGDFSVAESINSQGQIVGFSSLGNGGPGELTHAFLYEKGVMRDIGTLVELQTASRSTLTTRDRLSGYPRRALSCLRNRQE